MSYNFHCCIINRTLNGKPVNIQDFPAIEELSFICSLCNDSGVDYNDSKKCYEKIGEATETALAVLVEKLNVFGVDLKGKDPHQLANACGCEISKYFTKVCLYIIIILLYHLDNCYFRIVELVVTNCLVVFLCFKS